MASNETLRSSLNLITMMDCQEDRSDQGINAMAETAREEINDRECVFDWMVEGMWFNTQIFERAMRRNHHYDWEGFLNPFILRILQCFYATLKQEKLLAIKCLVMADKILRKGEILRDHKILQTIDGLRHVIGTTIASIFYQCGIYSKSHQYLITVSPFLSMSNENMAVVFYVRAQILFYSGPAAYVDSLKWTALGLQKNPMSSDLRFLCLQLIYNLWGQEFTTIQIQFATSHMEGFVLLEEAVPDVMTFGQFYGLTSFQRDVSNAVRSMNSALERVKGDSTPQELDIIELAIVMNLEVEPHYYNLIRSATQFFNATSQPEKACFLEGIGKLCNLDSACRWLDFKMLLFPELCDCEMYRGLLTYHGAPESAKIYKRIAYHNVMFDPDLAFRFASIALAQEKVYAVNGTELQVPTYDEKIEIFGSSTGIGFYRFMVYYAHTLASGESASLFLLEIQKVLPSYMEATGFSRETRNILDLLLKNEYYRDPFRTPLGGHYSSNLLHIYED